jgi:hypothetical protein
MVYIRKQATLCVAKLGGDIKNVWFGVIRSRGLLTLLRATYCHMAAATKVYIQISTMPGVLVYRNHSLFLFACRHNNMMLCRYSKIWWLKSGELVYT